MSGQTVTVSIQVPKAELRILRETLRLSRERQKDPAKFIKKTAVDVAKVHAVSTVYVHHWKHLQDLAGKLGVESPI
jgi:hypothetical protein